MGGDTGGASRPDVTVDAPGADRRLAGIAGQHIGFDRLLHDGAEHAVEIAFDMGDQDHAGIIELDQVGDREAKCAAGAMQDADGGGIADRSLFFQLGQ